MTSWFKYSYVCPTCDALIEITKTGLYTPQRCCGTEATYLSVVDATIPSSNQTKEETMETTQALALQEMIQKKDEYIVRLQNEISMHTTNIQMYHNSVTSLKEYLLDNYNELEMHADSIADIFDISLKREVTVTFVIHASATVDVEPGMDVEDIITDNVYVDANYGDIIIDDYSVESVEEC
jgi:hypothetical protein